MKNFKPPKYVRLGSRTEMRRVRNNFTNEFQYYRDAGHWYCDWYRASTGKIHAIIPSQLHIHGLELTPISEQEWRNGNRRGVA